MRTSKNALLHSASSFLKDYVEQLYLLLRTHYHSINDIEGIDSLWRSIAIQSFKIQLQFIITMQHISRERIVIWLPFLRLQDVTPTAFSNFDSVAKNDYLTLEEHVSRVRERDLFEDDC